MLNFVKYTVASMALAMTTMSCVAIADEQTQTVSVEIPPIELPAPVSAIVNVEIEGQGCVFYSQNNADPGKLLNGMSADVKTEAPVEFDFAPDCNGNGWYIAQVVYNGEDITELVINSELNRIVIDVKQNSTLYIRYEENVLEQPVKEEPQDILPKTGDNTNILGIIVPIVVGSALICATVAAIIIHNSIQND